MERMMILVDAENPTWMIGPSRVELTRKMMQTWVEQDLCKALCQARKPKLVSCEN